MNDDDWKPTLQAINELGTQVEQVGLLKGAIASGFLARCREATTAAELARATGLERGVVDEACDALRSIGVLADGEDEQLVISDLYAPLLKGGLDQRALDRLTAAGVRSTMFRDLFDEMPSSYWSIDSASRLALAANATGNPETEFGRESLIASVRANPDWNDVFTRGGRFLDLGCGVAGAIVSFLYHYPHLTAVGIDIAEDVLEVARARAQALGVADRATFLVADAASFRDPEPFDVVFWPQTFYPEPSRANALATIFANLRPGGLLVTAHVPPRSPRSGADGQADVGAGRALEPLLRKLWGIQERSFEALEAELEDAGFVNITAAPARSIVLPLVKAHRPD
jgi:SAM-dependent methyltransferase